MPFGRALICVARDFAKEWCVSPVMKKTALILCLVLCSLCANADFVVVEQIAATRQHALTITTKVKGGKCRKDYSNNTSVIYDLATGDSVRIDHAAKTYRITTGKEVAGVTEAFEKKVGTKPPRMPAVTDTGKTEKVNGHDAEVYTATSGELSYTFWVAKEYPDYAALRDEIKKFNARNPGTGVSAGAPQLDGIVLKSESLSDAGSVTTITLLSAKVQDVDDSEFKPPAGYQDVSSQPEQR